MALQIFPYIEFKVTKITYIQVTTILYPPTPQKEGYKQIQRLTCSKLCRQPPAFSLNFVNDKIPFFDILCQSSFRS